MWRRNALIVVIGLTLAGRSKLAGQDPECPDLLISDLSWVRFDVIMGRVVATTNRAKQDRQRARRELPDGTKETLAVSIDRGLTSVHYVLQSEQQKLIVHVVRRDDVEIEWTWPAPDGEPVTVSYLQRPGEDVRVSMLGQDGSERVTHVPSLWHLTVAHPELPSICVLEVLKALRRDWRPKEESDAILAALVDMSPRQVTTSVEEVQALVRQMTHRSFRVRQRADRELRARGRTVLCLLDELDPKQLDSEQRLRIGAIRNHLTGASSDTPERVANWLVNDKRMWLALLNHDDALNRRCARSHLVRIVNQPIDFDPTADTEARSTQFAALRTQLLNR